MADHLQVEGLGFRVMTLLGTSTEENLLRYRAYRGCYSFHGCGKVGRHHAWLCAIEVEGLQRRPPTVGGRPMPLGLLGLRFGV